MSEMRVQRRRKRLGENELARVRNSDLAEESVSAFASVFVFGSVSSVVLFAVVITSYPLRLLQIGLAIAIGMAAERAWVLLARRRRARRDL